MSIKIINAALDEFEGGIILRGVLDPDSLKELLSDEYQREVEPLSALNEIVDALKYSTVPDIELGMRGHKVIERDGVFFLQDPAYIVDGLQRVSAGLEMMKESGDRKPRIGAVVHFGTNRTWERDRFDILNSRQKRLSPNVLLRNMRHDNAAIGTIFSMTKNDNSFVLRDRVSWSQRQERKKLLTAMTLLRVTGGLHAHIGPGRSRSREALAHGNLVIMEKVGRNTYRDNVRTFFDLVDECWGVRRVVYRQGASYLKENFLIVLATLLSRHEVFWRGDRLFIEAPLARKIATFPVSDPHVASLASAGSTAQTILFQLMVEHINSGKRTKRLQPRDFVEALDSPVEDNGDNGNGDGETNGDT